MFCNTCGIGKTEENTYLQSGSSVTLHSNCKTCHAWHNRRRRYNLTVEELKDLEQRTNCDICGFAYERALDQCIDHDHATGTVRGVICRKCNLGLGQFDDDPARLREAANYIEEER